MTAVSCYHPPDGDVVESVVVIVVVVVVPAPQKLLVNKGSTLQQQQKKGRTDMISLFRNRGGKRREHQYTMRVVFPESSFLAAIANTSAGIK